MAPPRHDMMMAELRGDHAPPDTYFMFTYKVELCTKRARGRPHAAATCGSTTMGRGCAPTSSGRGGSAAESRLLPRQPLFEGCSRSC